MVTLTGAFEGRSFMLLLYRIVSDQRGVTAIEYALIVFLIGTAAVGAMKTLGLTLFNLAGPVGNALN